MTKTPEKDNLESIKILLKQLRRSAIFVTADEVRRYNNLKHSFLACVFDQKP